MPPVVINVRQSKDLRDVVHRAVQALTEGKLVAFPTETVYGVAARALDEEAVARLIAAKGREEGRPLTLAIKSCDEARDYAPRMSPLAQRLARRCWPGPITLVVDDTDPEGLVRQLPDQVQRAVCPTGTLGLRVPGHPVVLDVLRMVAGPLVLSSANRAGGDDPKTAGDVLASLDDDVALVLDDGPSRFGMSSTVVRIDSQGYQVIRAGVVPESALKRLSSLMILFVCTGNTCRSPMAETLFQNLVAEKLGCEASELPEKGVLVMSAGIAAVMGGRATSEAQQVMKLRGLDLTRHETQPLTESLVRHADRIFTMTQSHRQAILAQWPGAAERTFPLCVDGSDVSDPIGGPLDRYSSCADQIERQLKARLEEIDFST